MTKEAKRMGRPPKTAPRGQRVSLGLKVTAAVKRHIDSAARASGRTQSQEAEHLIERALQYERALGEFQQWQAKQRAEQDEIERGNLEAALRRKNWKLDGATGHWLPPEVHGLPPNGFIDPAAETERRQQAATLNQQLEDALERVVTRAVKAALEERDAK